VVTNEKSASRFEFVRFLRVHAQGPELASESYMN
jgi:hypothetical protein